MSERERILIWAIWFAINIAAFFWLGRKAKRGREAGWVSVEERLPDNHRQVLIHLRPVPEGPDWYPRTDVALSWYRKGWWGAFYDFETDSLKSGEFPDDGVVTHWRELPSPPERVAAGEEKGRKDGQ